MNRIILISLIILVGFNSCKNKKADKSTNAIEKTTKTTDINPNKKEDEAQPIIKERFIKDDRATATKEVDNFIKNSPKPIIFLTNDYYVVDYISDGKHKPKDMLDFGEWYRFEKNFTYEHGFFDEVKDNGKYTYDNLKKVLLMLPKDKKLFPSEWRILNSGDIVVLVGTSKFSNNPLQKHMQNVKEKPILTK